MLRYLETFYRHRLLLMAPASVVLLLMCAWVLVQPPTFQATVRLWAERQTLVNNPNDNQYVNPAQQQSGVLNELLNTKYFCLKVGARSPLKESLGAPGAGRDDLTQRLLAKLGGGSSGHLTGRALDDAVFQAVSTQTLVIPTGAETISITYRAASPELSAQVSQAIVDQFIDETLSTQRTQADAAEQFYSSQVKQTQTEVSAAQGQTDAYLTSHPEQRNASATPDASLGQLRKNQESIQKRLNDLQLKLDQARVSKAGLSQASVSGMRVLDKAEVPTRASSRRSVVLQGAAIGLGLALVILIGGILLLTLIDTTLRRPEEIEHALDLRPVGTVPRLT